MASKHRSKQLLKDVLLTVGTFGLYGLLKLNEKYLQSKEQPSLPEKSNGLIKEVTPKRKKQKELPKELKEEELVSKEEEVMAYIPPFNMKAEDMKAEESNNLVAALLLIFLLFGGGSWWVDHQRKKEAAEQERLIQDVKAGVVLELQEELRREAETKRVSIENCIAKVDEQIRQTLLTAINEGIPITEEGIQAVYEFREDLRGDCRRQYE